MNKRNSDNFTCRKCGIKIDGHNQYLHDRMCDDCFFKEYFPEEEIEYIPIKRLILKDNEKSKKIKNIHPNEEKYHFILGPIEGAICAFRKEFPEITDKDVKKVIKTIKKDPYKDYAQDDSSLIFAILYGISTGLKNKRITRHELDLVLNWILWCIDNRSFLGSDTAYLDFLDHFFEEGLDNDNIDNEEFSSLKDPKQFLEWYDKNSDILHFVERKKKMDIG